MEEEKMENVCSDIIRPLLISENRPVEEVREQAYSLANMLIDQITPEIVNDCAVLFIIVMRGALLIYPPFSEKFRNRTFTFFKNGTYTGIDTMEYDTAVIVDTIVETGKTMIDVKKFFANAGFSVKRWFGACLCSNISVKDAMINSFDRFYCIEWMENVRVTIDAGQYAANRN